MAPRKAAALSDRDDDRDLRAHLIATAERMMVEQGSAGLTVRAIARAAGVATGVLYNHFADKEELLAAALRAHVDEVQRGLGLLPQAGTGAVEANVRVYLDRGLALHRAIVPVIAGLLARPEVLARFAESDARQDWRHRLADYLHAERDLGRLAPDARVDAAVAVLAGICHDQVLSALLAARPVAVPPSLDSVVAVVLDGIRAPS
ncbi:TetR/AcrR family transcriptional regulator [Nocardia sp. CY41]|uniref:TetR/AcrR family transcriptional regulator n=1 Tax=Nocardia sp. CY41 TaxID=2608686 RepID=UPI00135964CC|nr:TetR/AcrR family transcriptional regulator [Nocardia sp. CY41]